jgi:hypothetical protein
MAAAIPQIKPGTSDDPAEPPTATAATEFLALWRSGACDADAHAQLTALLEQCPLSGRMIHGKPSDAGFARLLSSDDWKRLSWVFGPNALHGFLGKSSWEICLQLGFGERWLTERLASGKRFMLAVFPSESADARLATWDGVEGLLTACYPEVWGSKIAAHWSRIRSTQFAELEAEAGYSMLGECDSGQLVSLRIHRDPPLFFFFFSSWGAVR